MSDFLPPVIAVLASDLTSFSAGMQKAKAQMGEVEGSAAKMGSVIDHVGKVSTVAVLGIAGYSIDVAAKFQQATNVLKTAAGETDAGLRVVRDGIKQVAEQTGTSFSQLEAGAYILEKAGYRGANAVQMLRIGAEGAKAENANLGTVLNAATSVMASYHLKASQVVNVMNGLIAGAGEAKTTMEDYAGSLSTVLPIASAAGISFADVGGALATLTQHGTSADEATQELAATIRALQAPQGPAIKAMQQLGLSVVDVQQNMGRRGLTGTLDLLSETIMQHMGPSGLVMLNAFNQSKTAAQNANIMIGTLPKNLQSLAVAFRDGKISTSEWRSALKGLPVDQANLLRQFGSLENHARGFSDLLRSGGPAAQTYEAVLKQVTGGAIGLNTALQLTGENMATTTDHVKNIGIAMDKGGHDIAHWSDIVKTASNAMDRAKMALEVLASDLGDTLLPIVTTVADAISRHTGTVKLLAEAFGVVLVTAMTAWVGKLVWSTTMTALNLAAQILKWAGYRTAVSTIAGETATAVDGAMATEARALGGVATEADAAAAAMWRLSAAEDAAAASGKKVGFGGPGGLGIGGTLRGFAGLAALYAGYKGVKSVYKTFGHANRDLDSLKDAATGQLQGTVPEQIAQLNAIINKQMHMGDFHKKGIWKGFWGTAELGAEYVIGNAPGHDDERDPRKLLNMLFARRNALMAMNSSDDAKYDKGRLASAHAAGLTAAASPTNSTPTDPYQAAYEAALRQYQAGEDAARRAAGSYGSYAPFDAATNHRHHGNSAALRAAAHLRRQQDHARATEMTGLREAENALGVRLREGKATEQRTHHLLPPATLAALQKNAEALLARAKIDELHTRGTRQHIEALNLLHKAIKDKAAALALGKLSPSELAAVQAATLRERKKEGECEGAENHLHVFLDGHEIYKSVQKSGLRAEQFNVNNGLSRT